MNELETKWKESRKKKNAMANDVLDKLLPSKEFLSLLKELSDEYPDQLSFLTNHGWRRAKMGDIDELVNLMHKAYKKNGMMAALSDVVSVAEKTGIITNDDDSKYKKRIRSRIYPRLANGETTLVVYDKNSNKIVQTSSNVDLCDQNFYDRTYYAKYDSTVAFASRLLEKLILKYETVVNNNNKGEKKNDDLTRILSLMPTVGLDCDNTNNIKFLVDHYGKYCFNCMTVSDQTLRKPILLVITTLLLEYAGMKGGYQYFTGFLLNTKMKRAASNANTVDFSFDVDLNDFSTFLLSNKESLTNYIRNSENVDANARKQLEKYTLFGIPIKTFESYQQQLSNDLSTTSWKSYAKRVIASNVDASKDIDQTQFVITRYQSKL